MCHFFNIVYLSVGEGCCLLKICVQCQGKNRCKTSANGAGSRVCSRAVPPHLLGTQASFFSGSDFMDVPESFQEVVILVNLILYLFWS